MSQRVKQVNELIKRELGQIILKEMNFPENALVTITEVKASSNLSLAKVYIKVMPEPDYQKIKKLLNGNIYELQQTLNKRLRMRPVPKIEFTEEKNLINEEKIEEIFEKIKVEKDK